MKALTMLFGLWFVEHTQAQSLLKLSGTAIPTKGCAERCVITIFLGEVGPEDAKLQSSWVVSASVVGPPPQTLKIRPAPEVSQDSVNLAFREETLNGLDPRKVTWNIAYVGSRGPVMAPAPPIDGSEPSAPKARADAEIYVSGSWLAGQGSKPLYIADAKINVLRRLKGRSIRGGLLAEVLTNTGTELPVNRTELDPDSIKASLTFDRLYRKDIWLFNGWFWTWKAAGGEFTRKHPVSNFTSDVVLGTSLRPGLLGGAWYTLYPSAGVELGRNLNKPDTLFKRPVDLSGYNGIARLVAGAEGAIGIYPAKGDPKLLLSTAFHVRTPLTDEPFTALENVPGADGATERVKVVRLRRNARPFSRNGLVWNLTSQWAIALEHRYGSLTPLFELTRHQVSLGIVYKRGVARSR